MTAKRLHGYRWVQRNEDKPHRCPNCHAIAARAWLLARLGRGHGPRTVYACCGLKWRAGRRAKRDSMRFDQIIHPRGRAACPACE